MHEPAPRTLASLFEPSFVGRRDAVGLEWQGSTFTFADLDERADRAAAELVARGLRPGDRLAVQLPNGLALIDLFLACARTGVIFVPINPLYKGRETHHVLRDADPVAIVSHGTIDASAGVDAWPSDDVMACAARRAGSQGSRVPGGDDAERVVALVYTSGTTGPPKGAMLTQRSLVANARTLIDAWRVSAGDRLLLPLPLFHVHGLGNGLHCWLGAGCRLRLLERFDVATIERELIDFAPTLVFGVPTMYVRLLDVPPEAARRIGSRMRLFVSGSAPLDPATFSAFETRFGHAILERYGMTETLMIASNPYEGARVPGTVGMPLPGVEVRLADDRGRDVGPDGEGEVLVKSPALFAGYWRQPEATQTAFEESWFKTGDVARRSADGRYTLCGRKSDLIISGGYNIYPRELEELIREADGVADAAVIGVPDPVRGEVPVAYVVAAGTIPPDPASLEAFCRERVASFKVPRSFVAIEQLPRNALGKIDKRRLAATVPLTPPR